MVFWKSVLTLYVFLELTYLHCMFTISYGYIVCLPRKSTYFVCLLFRMVTSYVFVFIDCILYVFKNYSTTLYVYYFVWLHRMFLKSELSYICMFIFRMVTLYVSENKFDYFVCLM